MPEKFQLSDFPTRKKYRISIKALKEQFSKMADVGNFEAPKSLPQCLILQENFENFGLSGSKWVYLYDKFKIRDIWSVFEVFRTFFVIFGRFLFKISGKILKRFYVIFVERPNFPRRQPCKGILFQRLSTKALHNAFNYFALNYETGPKQGIDLRVRS